MIKRCYFLPGFKKSRRQGSPEITPRCPLDCESENILLNVGYQFGNTVEHNHAKVREAARLARPEIGSKEVKSDVQLTDREWE